MPFFCSDVPLPTELFATSTLCLPAISSGSVGQLACDLLISTFQMTHIGYIDSQYLTPLVGGDPFTRPDAPTRLALCCEVYHAPDRQLVVIQQRAAPMKVRPAGTWNSIITPFGPGEQGCSAAFSEQLMGWVRAAGFRAVIVLTGADLSFRQPDQLAEPGKRYICTSTFPEPLRQRMGLLGWAPLEQYQRFHQVPRGSGNFGALLEAALGHPVEPTPGPRAGGPADGAEEVTLMYELAPHYPTHPPPVRASPSSCGPPSAAASGVVLLQGAAPTAGDAPKAGGAGGVPGGPEVPLCGVVYFCGEGPAHEQACALADHARLLVAATCPEAVAWAPPPSWAPPHFAHGSIFGA
ncbi:putative proteasome assembly chaperone 2 [Paratrimastix pyriformis]|uniref:Proteasome assembly chaperone 2 n=1 Tax=Paratrimastix pyriformis TaxID=342808 RepID=A0ABQ8UMR0_9EUKA|nr:putative proteasome assembly chaperone 2 [Paratrimastix pyriformis]